MSDPTLSQVLGALRSLLERFWVVLVLAGGLTALTAAGAFDNSDLKLTLTEMLIRLVAVVGLYIFVGNSGIFSFGHAGFMCIGAYAAVWATVNPAIKTSMLTGLPPLLEGHTYPFLVSTAGAAVLPAIVALATGVAIMRLSDLAGSIATFAILIIVNRVYLNWDSVTGGASAIVGLPTPVGPWTALAFATAALVIAYLFQSSRYGLMLRASRDDDIAARSSAVDILWVRVSAFVLSAAVLGVAGALYAQFLGVMTVQFFYIGITFLLLAMLVVGGAGSLTGAVVGVIVVTCLVEVLRRLEQGVNFHGISFSLRPGVQEIGLGILLSLILIFRPTGLTRSREIGNPLQRERPRSTLPVERLDGSQAPLDC